MPVLQYVPLKVSVVPLSVAAVITVGAIGLAVQPAIARIPRSLLQLVVGTMLTTFGTFWAVEGIGVVWPAGDAAIVVLLAIYALAALTLISLERRQALGFSPWRQA